jgi:glycine C-acetyltransferase
MLGEAAVAQEMSAELLKAGVYIKGLWYPVVPKGEARLRAQVSAALSKKDMKKALTAFEKVGKRMNII